MKKQIELNEFRYWLFTFSILINCEDFSHNNYYKACRDSKSLIRHIRNCWLRSTSIPNLYNEKENSNFDELYLFGDSFLGYTLIITFGKLNEIVADKCFKSGDAYNVNKIFGELKNELLLKSQSSDFYNNTKYMEFESPIILKIEPEHNIFSDLNSEDFINEIISFLDLIYCNHGFSIFDDCVLANLPYSNQIWEGLVFINTKKRDDDNNIFVSVILFDIIEQLACYFWLDFRKNQLRRSKLKEFEFKSLVSNTTFDQTIELHNQVLLGIGQFNEYQITLMDEIIIIRNLNSKFIEFIKTAKKSNKILEPNHETIITNSIIEKLESDVYNSLNYLDRYLNRLENKSTILSSYSHDKINTEISVINLKLQKILTCLTIFLIILTIILVVDSQTINDIIVYIFEKF